MKILKKAVPRKLMLHFRG